MESEYQYQIDGLYLHYVGEVRGQGRPRHTRSGVTYTASADRVYRIKLIETFRRQAAGWTPTTCPVFVYIDVYRKLPKSTPKKIHDAPDTVKPDVDNIAKAVLDALNGIAYVDDRQVVSLTVTKHNRTHPDIEPTEPCIDVEILPCEGGVHDFD